MIAPQDSTLTPGAMHSIESEQTSKKESHISLKLDRFFMDNVGGGGRGGGGEGFY